MVKVHNGLFETLIENYAENDLVKDYGHNKSTEFIQAHPWMLYDFLTDIEDSEINTEILEEICNNSVVYIGEFDDSRGTLDKDDLQEFLDDLNLDIDVDELLDSEDYDYALIDFLDQEGIWYKANADGIIAVIPHP